MARRWKRAAAAAALALLAGGRLRAQDAPAADARAPSALARTQPAAMHARAAALQPGEAVEIDGRLREAVWERAAPLAGFRQRQPAEGAPAAEPTEVRVAYDDQALYVGARMTSRDPAALHAPLSRRDNPGQAEYLLVSLDTYLDRRTAYTFGVTAAGTRLDWFHPSDSEDDTDPSFDPVWEAAVRRDSAGWTAELRIPFAQLRFVTRPEQVWGIEVTRWNPATREKSYWVLVPTTASGWASRFGTLAGIAGLRPGRRVELMPYAATGATYTANPGQGNPFDSGSRYTVRAGGDLKMGLGSSLTLSATLNPDFGQVEADPAVVNLSAYETFFDERRPFFTEGSELFGAGEVVSGGARQYFYSRRIGAAPADEVVGGVLDRVVGDYGFLDQPRVTRVLGAAKLTGRPAPGLSLGALAALTDAGWARTFSDSGGVRRVRVAPTAGYGVVRAQRELRGGRGTGGLTFTAVRRDLSAGEPLAQFLTRQAFSGGTDWNLRFHDGDFQVKGTAGLSHVDGDSAAILRLQRASARYYQRPDAHPSRLDPGRTSLSGYAGSLEASRVGGGHWLWDVLGSAVSPGFELNDAGYLDVADELYAEGTLRYRETRPGPLARNYQFRLTSLAQWNYERVNTYRAVQGEARATWHNFWTTIVASQLNLPALSNDATRGGPLMRTGRDWRVAALLIGPPGRRVGLTSRLDVGGGELGGRLTQLSGTVTLQASPRWQLSAEPSLRRETVDRQYAGSVADGPAATYGRRYLFAFIDRNTLSLPLRLNYTFTPDLSLELYAEPFAASGHFYRFGELRAARSQDVRVYGTEGTTIAQDGEHGSYAVTDDAASFTIPYRDFNVYSFRSNAVLRWEWRPGSTLFVVWQQNREGFDATGRPVGVTDLADTFRTAPDDFLAIKVTYWIPVR